MIKEFILASALTLSAPPYPHFYNVEEDYGRMWLSFESYDWVHYNSHIINLNNGFSDISLLSVNDDGIYQMSNTTSWSDIGIKNFHDILTSTFHENYDGDIHNIPDDFSLAIELDTIIYDFSSVDDVLVIPCFIAIPGEDDSTLLNVSGMQELRISKSYNSCSLYFYDWLDVYSWVTSDNSYLVLLTDGIESDNSNEVDFSYISMYCAYTNMYIGLNEDFFPVNYNDFIYNNMRDWVSYAQGLDSLNEELLDENSQLTAENEEYERINEELLDEISQLTAENEEYERINQVLVKENDELEISNQELIKENDELNSKHALSSIFEIVRGAFDGIVNFLEIELMPNLTIGTILFIPVVIGVIFFILKALVL